MSSYTIRDLCDMWNKGIRHIQYPNGHLIELRRSSSGKVFEFPVETKEEKIIREKEMLKRRIAEDTARLAKLESGL